jgi:hypothetical protein
MELCLLSTSSLCAIIFPKFETEVGKMRDAKSVKKFRHKSPSYPSLDLRTAIAEANKIYRERQLSTMTTDFTIKALGYSPKSGGGIRALAALLSFGLLDAEGRGQARQLKLSKLAESILTNSDVTRRQQAIREAALSPEIHKRVWNEYEGELPDDEILNSYLVKQKFNPSTTEKLIEELRDTFEFAKLSGGIISDRSEVMRSTQTTDFGSSRSGDDKAQLQRLPQTNVQYREFAFPTLSGGSLVLRVPALFTREDYEALTQWIKLMEKPLIAAPPSASEKNEVDEQDK